MENSALATVEADFLSDQISIRLFPTFVNRPCIISCESHDTKCGCLLILRYEPHEKAPIKRQKQSGRDLCTYCSSADFLTIKHQRGSGSWSFLA